jgi:hypothetical protein
LVFLAVVGLFSAIPWIGGFAIGGWLHSMTMDNPVRQTWQPRCDFIIFQPPWVLLGAGCLYVLAMLFVVGYLVKVLKI